MIVVKQDFLCTVAVHKRSCSFVQICKECKTGKKCLTYGRANVLVTSTGMNTEIAGK